jgi:ribosomal protein S12 methylthiotransferase accessory factor
MSKSKVEAARVGSPRLAPNVRIAPTREGAIVLSPKGCFRVTEKSRDSFVSDVLPEMCGVRRVNPASNKSSVGWPTSFLDQLEEAGIIEVQPHKRTLKGTHDTDADVALVRPTPLTERALKHLATIGIRVVDSESEKTFIIADFSGLDTDSSVRLARKVHLSGRRSISIWSHGAETFFGPLVYPLYTACWNCCRVRFSDSIAQEKKASTGDETANARVVAETTLLAVRYPEVAAYGCLVADDGRISSIHSVVPVPGCEVCQFNGAFPASSIVFWPRQSPHIPDEFRPLADTRGGVIRRILFFDSDTPDEPRIPTCCTATIAPTPYRGKGQAAITGEGKGTSRCEAIRSAIGEGIERYSASIWDPSILTYASYNELRDQAFDPRWLVLYDDEQYAQPEFPFVPFKGETPIHWITGLWLDTNERVHLPAFAAYMNFPTKDEERLAQTTSNGLAAGESFADAALRALYELIERDAFLVFWLARRPAVRVAVDVADRFVCEALREVERLGARTELYLLDAGTRHPTMVCLGLGDGQSWPGLTIGLGTHADVDIALRRAVVEHGHYGSYMRRLMRDGRHKMVASAEDVQSGLDHGLYYIHANHGSAMDYFRTKGEEPVRLEELRSEYREEASLSTCVSCLAEVGIRTAAVDLTSPDVELAPIKVVRAFGVHMQPIHFGANNRRLRNPRLDQLLSNGAETNPHPVA